MNPLRFFAFLLLILAAPLCQATGSNCVTPPEVNCKGTTVWCPPGEEPPTDTTCLGADQPPVPSSLDCVLSNDHFLCEAFPQDDGSTLVYTWTVQPLAAPLDSKLNSTVRSAKSAESMKASGPAPVPVVTLPVQSVYCGGSQYVQVSVTIANGTASTSMTRTLACPILQ